MQNFMAHFITYGARHHEYTFVTSYKPYLGSTFQDQQTSSPQSFTGSRILQVLKSFQIDSSFRLPAIEITPVCCLLSLKTFPTIIPVKRLHLLLTDSVMAFRRWV